jgi:hypothetical protein
MDTTMMVMRVLKAIDNILKAYPSLLPGVVLISARFPESSNTEFLSLAKLITSISLPTLVIKND